ncbi:MAG TPA: hypothetical protein QF571_11840 [Desulfobacterales bacterium]|jgi:hypothetical protein|nr:hypothetical protein [Desulfobacterales bacterium]|tara:strand:+ start:275 stop:661 length:387 start_codon:yes stop_codon:yes gene_type:complete
MGKLEGVCREVLDKAEWVAIVTSSGDSPHLVGTWADYIRSFGIKDDGTLIIPAGYYHKTEENLKKDKNIQLLMASKVVQGTYGPGQGCIVYGQGEVQTKGEFAQLAKEKFSWARGALVVKIKECKTQL